MSDYRESLPELSGVDRVLGQFGAAPHHTLLSRAISERHVVQGELWAACDQAVGEAQFNTLGSVHHLVEEPTLRSNGRSKFVALGNGKAQVVGSEGHKPYDTPRACYKQYPKNNLPWGNGFGQ